MSCDAPPPNRQRVKSRVSNMDAMNDPGVRKIIMQQVHLTTRQELSKKQLHGVAAHSTLNFCEHIGGMMALDLDTYIMGMEGERIVVNERWPRDWWQAVRERWLPAWWLERYPVQYNEIDIDEQKFAAVCPHIDVRTDDTHIMWLAEKGADIIGSS